MIYFEFSDSDIHLQVSSSDDLDDLKRVEKYLEMASAVIKESILNRTRNEMLNDSVEQV